MMRTARHSEGLKGSDFLSSVSSHCKITLSIQRDQHQQYIGIELQYIIIQLKNQYNAFSNGRVFRGRLEDLLTIFCDFRSATYWRGLSNNVIVQLPRPTINRYEAWVLEMHWRNYFRIWPRAFLESKIYVLKVLLCRKNDKWEIFCDISVQNICHHFFILNMILSTECQFPKYFCLSDTDLTFVPAKWKNNEIRAGLLVTAWRGPVWSYQIFIMWTCFTCFSCHNIFIAHNLPQLIRPACQLVSLVIVWEPILSSCLSP